MLTADSEGVTVRGYYGTYYVADSALHNGGRIFLMKSEQSGDIEDMIVSDDGRVMHHTVRDVFDALSAQTGDTWRDLERLLDEFHSANVKRLTTSERKRFNALYKAAKTLLAELIMSLDGRTDNNPRAA
jgi:hypothetical protein